MKKLAVVIFALVLAMALLSCAEKQTEGIEFTQRDGVYAVTGYNGSDVDVVIPDTYNNIPVVIIAKNAFANSDIQTIKIGSNVEEIEEDAFANATLLKRVDLNSRLEVIGKDGIFISMEVNGAFRGCINLEAVNIPDDCKLEILGRGTFYDCEKLKGIVLPEGLKKIGELAFGGCIGVNEIQIPKSVEYVENAAFSAFTEAQEIIICGSSAEWASNWNRNCEAEITNKG